jgi:O-antigen/teichoic acid export membrane protein
MQALPAAIFLVLLLVGMVLGATDYMPVYAQFSAWSVAAGICIWLVIRTFNNQIRPDDHVQPVRFQEIIGLSAPMLMTSSMHFFIGEISILILGAFRPEAEVGYYSVAVRLSTLTSFILGAINSMAAPRFSELFHSGEMEDLFHVAKKSTKLIFWSTVPILIFLIVLGHPVLVYIFGKEYSAAYPALCFLVIGQFVNSVSGSTGFFMSMTGYQKAFMIIVAVAAAISITCNYLLVPQFGIIGAAIASMVSVCFWNLYTLWYIKMKYGRTIGYLPVFGD